MKLTASLQATDPSTNKTVTTAYGNVNRNYVGLTGSSSPTAALPFRNGTRYDSFADWADAVFRGINSLSENSYYNFTLTATFYGNEETMS